VSRRWVLACAAAETIGMAASAAAARAADGRSAAPALALLVLGGLVEGAALGLLQARALAPLVDRGRRRAWALVTVLVAGLGWAAGSAASILAGDDSGGAPPFGLVLLGAAMLGLVMGAALGAAQAAVLRQVVRHPQRWVAASAAGWAVAMPIIFAGATSAGRSWPWLAVVVYGALTGALAGTGLGLVTSVWLSALDGPPLRHRWVLRHLASGTHPAAAGMTALQVTGAHSGRTFRFPVMCAALGPSSLVVLPGHPERKTWWRQLDRDSDIAVLDRGAWVRARARVVTPGSIDWSVARSAYVARWRRARIEGGPLVVVDLRSAGADREVPDQGDQGPVDPGPDAVGAGAART